MLKRLAIIALFFTSVVALAQVPLGGHVFVPSSSDSTNGEVQLTFIANGNCSITSPAPNCTVSDIYGNPMGASAPYVGAIYVYDSVGIGAGNVITLPFSPGRAYFINNTTTQDLGFWGGTGATVTVPANSTGFEIWSDGTTGYFSVGSKAGIVNGTGNLALQFPGSSSMTLGQSGGGTAQNYYQMFNDVSVGSSNMCWAGSPGDSAGYRLGGNTDPSTHCGFNYFLANFYFESLAPGYIEAESPLYLLPEYSQGVCTTAATIDANEGNNQTVSLTTGDACNLTFTQPARGTATIQLKVIQDTTSPYAGTITASGVTWLNGGPPTIPTTSGATAFISCYLDGTVTWCGLNTGTGGGLSAPVLPSQLAVNFNGFVTVPPVGSSVYPNQQTFGSGGWTFCGFSCSGGYSGGTSTGTFGVTTPSLTNNAIKIQVNGNSGGGSPTGTNAQVYRMLDCTTLPGGTCNGFTYVARTLSQYTDPASATPQGLEGPNVVAYDGAHQYYASVQCATNAGSSTPTIPTYNAWTGTAWVSPDSTSCATVASTKGVAQIWQVHYSFNFATAQFCYQDLMVNGMPVAKWQHKNLCYSAIVDGSSAAVKIQEQLDGNTTSGPTTVYYDYDNASFWSTTLYSLALGITPPAACGSATGCIAFNDASTAGTPTSGESYIRADSTSGHLLYSLNGSAEANLISSSVANTTITVGSGVSFAANTCSSYTGTGGTASTTTMTGLGTGMTITHTPTSDVHAVTGWSPASAGALYFTSWPTANTLNDYVCNPTGTAIVTGGSVTWNVSVK